MFVHELGHKQKEAFFVLLHEMALADEKLVEEEETARSLLRREADLDTLPDPEAMTVSEAVGHFDNTRNQITVLLELLLVAHVDDVYHPEEHSLIQRLVSDFGISLEKLELLKNWVLRQGALLREAEKLRQD